MLAREPMALDPLRWRRTASFLLSNPAEIAQFSPVHTRKTLAAQQWAGMGQPRTEKIGASDEDGEQRDHGRPRRGCAGSRPPVRGAVCARPRDARDSHHHEAAGAAPALTTEGEVGDDFFVIDRGRRHDQRARQQLCTLGPGDSSAGSRSFRRHAPRPRSPPIRARLLVLPKAHFLELLAAYPAIEDEILVTAASACAAASALDREGRLPAADRRRRRLRPGALASPRGWR